MLWTLLLSSVLVVTLDTTRRDALRPETMPMLSARAAQGLRLDRAYAAAPVTVAAHSAMFTGKTPGQLGIWGNMPGIDAKDIAEEFAEAGYVTHAIPALPRLFNAAHFGFGTMDQPGTTVRDAATQTTRALAWLASPPPKFFLWLHYFDAHEYKSQEDYYEKVKAVDAELGKVLAAVPADTFVVVVADHGEEIGAGHMGRLTDNVAHIPLVIYGPGVKPGVSDEVVRQYDVFSTICEVFALGCSTEHGTSLKPLFTDAKKKLPLDWAYMESSRYGFAVRDRTLTIEVGQSEVTVGGQKRAQFSGKEKALLEAGIAKYRKRGPRPDGRVPQKEVIETLKALGYIQ